MNNDFEIKEKRTEFGTEKGISKGVYVIQLPFEIPLYKTGELERLILQSVDKMSLFSGGIVGDHDDITIDIINKKIVITD